MDHIKWMAFYCGVIDKNLTLVSQQINQALNSHAHVWVEKVGADL